MTAPLVPNVLLTGTAPPWLEEVRPVLEQAAGAAVESCPLGDARAADVQTVNQQLQQVYQQVDADLELARHIHRGFLPRSLPSPHRARFAVCYRPRSRVGGDFFDVARLDEEHAGFWVADAMGG